MDGRAKYAHRRSAGSLLRPEVRFGYGLMDGRAKYAHRRSAGSLLRPEVRFGYKLIWSPNQVLFNLSIDL